MTPQPDGGGDDKKRLPNGHGAAAILAAGLGSLTLGVFAFAGDAYQPVRRFFNFWNPSGPLSGVTIGAIGVWLAVWFLLAKRWRARDVNLTVINVASFIMLFLGLLFTFPPFMDAMQFK